MTINSEKIIDEVLDEEMKHTVPEARKLLYFMIDPDQIKRSSETYKHLFFEMYPLLYVAERLENVKWIKFSGAHKKYDGIIKFQDNPSQQRIEFVRALDIEQEIIKNQLEKMLNTPSGLKVEEGNSFVYNKKQQFKIMKTMKWLWRKAYTKKLAKNNKTGQYEGVWLGIVFDDTMLPPSSYGRIEKRAKNIWRKYGKRAVNPFQRVFLIGLSGKFIFDTQSTSVP